MCGYHFINIDRLQLLGDTHLMQDDDQEQADGFRFHSVYSVR